MNAIIDKFNVGSAPAAKSGFKIDPHDRITINGKAYRMSRHVGDNVELVPADEDGLVEQFPMSTLGRLSAMGRVQHEVGYYLPDDLKMSAGIADAHFRVSDLTEKQRMRFLARYAQVMAVEELVEAGELQNNTGDIEKSKSRIEELARPYLQQAAAEHALINHDLEFRSDQTLKTSSRKSKGGKTVVTIDLFHSDTIRKLVANYRKHGVAALVDSLAKSGNRTRSFRPEELKLMMKLIQGSYLTTERKSKKPPFRM